MKTFLRTKLPAILFFAVIFLLCALTVLLPKETVSASERRELARFPEFSVETLLDGKFFAGLSDYAADHFALREPFRMANTALRTGVFRQDAVEGVFADGDFLFTPPGPLDEKAVFQNARLLQSVAETYFPENKHIYCAVIPDKSDFTEKGPPRLSTEDVVQTVQETLDAEYIDLTETLALSDYYRTDTHWRQEKIGLAAKALLTGMGGEWHNPDFEWRTLDEPFYGVLWGRYAAPLPGETLSYGVNAATEAATVCCLDDPNMTAVYVPETDSPDKYDLFLGGAVSFVEIESPLARTEKHLVVFRDSFGSAIAPYFLGEYAKVTLVDLRYVASSRLADLLTEADDVLFLYSTGLLNTGGILR